MTGDPCGFAEGPVRICEFCPAILFWLMSGNWCVWLAEPHEARATLHLKSLSSVRMRVGLGRPSEGVGPSPTTYPT